MATMVNRQQAERQNKIHTVYSLFVMCIFCGGVTNVRSLQCCLIPRHITFLIVPCDFFYHLSMKYIILSICLFSINTFIAQVGVPRVPDLEAVANQPIYVVIPEDTAGQSYQVCLAFMNYWNRSKTIPLSEQEFLRNPGEGKVYFRTVKGYFNYVNPDFRLDTTIKYYNNRAGIMMLSKKAASALENDKRMLVRDYEFLMEFMFNEDVKTKTGTGDRLILKNRVQQTEALINSDKSIRLLKDFADKTELPKLMGDTLLVVFRDRIPGYEAKALSKSQAEIDKTMQSYRETLSSYYHYPFKVISESQLNTLAREKVPHYYLHFTDLRVYTRPWQKKHTQFSVVNSLTGAELLRDKCSVYYSGIMMTNEWKAIISRIYKGMGVLSQYKRELVKDKSEAR